ncbi:MAG: MCE family protein [Methylophilaceae bacterium]|nr:MCE family protein [Methylophilaceae bacterium]
MENKSHALIAGLFIIALGIALTLIALWFDRDTKERLPYELVTKASVSGLSKESAVRYRGLDIGKVENISFDPKVAGQILVRIAVEKGTPITRSTFATLGYQGVTGLAYIQLDDDGKIAQNSPLNRLPTDADKLARIELRPGLLDKLSGGSEGLLIQLDAAARRLNQLLDAENQKVLMHTLSSLDDTTVSIGKLASKLQPALEGLPQVVSDAHKTLGSFKGMAQDFSGLMVKIQAPEGALERFNASLARFDLATGSVRESALTLGKTTAVFSTETLPLLNQLAEDGAQAVRAVDRAVDALSGNPQSLIFGEAKIRPGPGEQDYEGVSQ